MLKVTLESNNTRIESMAELLNDTTDNFTVWFHNNALYSFFHLKSLQELMALSKKLERLDRVKFKYTKIQKVKSSWL